LNRKGRELEELSWRKKKSREILLTICEGRQTLLQSTRMRREEHFRYRNDEGHLLMLFQKSRTVMNKKIR
jgi:hypothetical protein